VHPIQFWPGSEAPQQMRTYWVVFADVTHHTSGIPEELLKRLSRGFRHCLVFWQQGDGMMLFFHPRLKDIEIFAIAGRPTEWIRYYLERECRVLVVDRPLEDVPGEVYTRVKHRGIINCATLCAVMLRVDKPALTPKSLFRALLEDHGATELKLDVVRIPHLQPTQTSPATTAAT